MWDGFERFSGGWFENFLIPVWILAIPGLKEKLDAGAEVAEVGCGRGRAIFKMAKEYPRSRFVGSDNYPPTIELATANAKSEGVSDRVRFEDRDCAAGMPESKVKEIGPDPKG